MCLEVVFTQQAIVFTTLLVLWGTGHCWSLWDRARAPCPTVPIEPCPCSVCSTWKELAAGNGLCLQSGLHPVQGGQ